MGYLKIIFFSFMNVQSWLMKEYALGNRVNMAGISTVCKIKFVHHGNLKKNRSF
jgi:hypothetical protein